MKTEKAFGLAKRIGIVACGSAAALAVWLVALWYRGDPVFSDEARWSVEWAATWFFGVGAGLCALLIFGAATIGIVKLAKWVITGSTKNAD